MIQQNIYNSKVKKPPYPQPYEYSKEKQHPNNKKDLPKSTEYNEYKTSSSIRKPILFSCKVHSHGLSLLAIFCLLSIIIAKQDFH